MFAIIMPSSTGIYVEIRKVGLLVDIVDKGDKPARGAAVLSPFASNMVIQVVSIKIHSRK